MNGIEVVGEVQQEETVVLHFQTPSKREKRVFAAPPATVQSSLVAGQRNPPFCDGGLVGSICRSTSCTSIGVPTGLMLVTCTGASVTRFGKI